MHISRSGKHNAYTERNIKQSWELGWVLGFVRGRGFRTIQKRQTVQRILCCYVPGYTRTVVVGFFDNNDINVGVDARGVRVSWTSFAGVLVDWMGAGAFNKKLTSAIFGLTRETRMGVLCGYLAGDGSVPLRRGYARAQGGSRSECLIDDLMLLATTLGIDTTKTDYQVDGLPFYKFEIRSQDITKLTSIGHVEKDHRLQTCPTWSGKKSYRHVPIHDSLHRLVVAKSTRKEQFRHRSYVDQHTQESLLERITPEECPWVTADVIWDKVSDIQDIDPESTTYDLDLGDATFMCGNGVIVHNSKFGPQALPLVNREAPLVRTSDRSRKGSTEKQLGTFMGAIRAPNDGVVKSVYKDHMTLSTAEGDKRIDLYDNHPFARKTFIRNTAKVKTGQRVSAGDLMATSNFTDDEGVTALGTNLRVAYLNYDGKVFEDAIVISEGAAKRLTSEHMYRTKFDDQKDVSRDREKYRALFPGTYNKKQLSSIGEDGVVKPGSVLGYGDPMVLAVEERDPSQKTLGRRVRKDASVVWQHHFPGIVTDANISGKKVRVNVRANTPMRTGDKLANRFGGKGVIAEIIPDNQMPADPRGRPYEVLLSPLSIHSRTNPTQKHEVQLGKISARTGKPYELPGFTEDPESNLEQFVSQELRKHRMSDTAEVLDPKTGKKIPDVFEGVSYFYKLQHTAEGKGKARATAKYTAEDQPARGGKDGAKHLGDMEIQALLSHDAGKVLKDLKIIKGQKNDSFWRQLKMGETPSMPGTPVVYDKFKSLLLAAGVNLTEDKQGDHIFAMTDAQAVKLTGNRRIKSTDTLADKTMAPIAGGLFDPEATGSRNNGDRWAYIELPEPMPNPVMEDPLRRVLGLKQKEYAEAVASGELHGQPLSEAFKRVNLGAERDRTLNDIKHGSKSKRDDAVKRFRYIDAMIAHDVRPEDFLMTRVPVLPPKYRPITRQDDMTMVADPNYLYKSLMEGIEDYQDAKDLPQQVRQEARAGMYDSYRSLVGISDPQQAQLQQKNVKGVIQQIFGKGSPKFGFVQRRVIGTNIDVSGLGVVTPNPSLKLDQIGMPESLAWNLYEPFIIRHMVKAGVPAMQAATDVAGKKPGAYKALQAVVKDRPVLVNRAPTLHKYSIMAFKPVLVKGNTIQVPPPVVGPFGMDFDGDDRRESLIYLLVLPEMCRTVCPYLTQEALDMHCKQTAVTIHGTQVEGYVLPVRPEDIPHTQEPADYIKHKNARYYEVPDGVFALAYDEETRDLRAAPVTYYSEHGVTTPIETVIVTLDSGRQLLTDDDPRAVYGYDPDTCEFGRWRPSDAIGKFVPRCIKLPVIPEMYFEIPGPVACAKSKYTDRLPKKIRLDAAAGYMFGAFVGDGWAEHNEGEPVGVCLAVTEDQVEERFKRSFSSTMFTPDVWSRRVSKITDDGSYGDSTVIRCSSKDAGAFIAPIIGKGVGNKHLPPFWPGTPHEFRKGLLEGIIDTDGSISVNRTKKKPQLLCSIHTTSAKLSHEVQMLLRSLGLDSRISPYETPAGAPAFNVVISTKKLKDLGLVISHPENADALENTPVALETSRGGRHYTVPMSLGMAALLRKRFSYRDPSTVGLYRALSDAIKHGRPNISVNKAKEIAEGIRKQPQSCTADVLAWLRLVDNTDSIVWDRVISQEASGVHETGWDLTVPGFETFMSADGLILSNTAAFTVPVSQEAVEQAREKMLPSRNLISSRSGRSTYAPSNEYLQGLYFATKPATKKKTQYFQDPRGSNGCISRGNH